jgi:hypothetical protein
VHAHSTKAQFRSLEHYSKATPSLTGYIQRTTVASPSTNYSLMDSGLAELTAEELCCATQNNACWAALGKQMDAQCIGLAALDC